MKYESPSSRESWTRMLLCRSHGGRRKRVRADAAARLRKHGVQTDGAKQRALARHVRSGHQQERSGRAHRHVVGRRDGRRQSADDPALRRRDDPTRHRARGTAQPGLSRRAVASADSASISPSASSQSRTCAPAVCTPALECKQHVKVPERQGLNGKWKNRRARCASSANPSMRLSCACSRERTSPIDRQTVLKSLQKLRVVNRAVVTCSNRRRISRSACCPAPARSKARIHPLRIRKRQDDSGKQRNQPERRVETSRRNSANRIQIGRSGQGRRDTAPREEIVDVPSMRTANGKARRTRQGLRPGEERRRFLSGERRGPAHRVPRTARASRRGALSSATAAWRARHDVGCGAGCKSHVARRKLPRAVAAGPSHWNSDARPKRSRSMA